MPQEAAQRPGYVQVHYMTSYPGALPNRDKSGLNKVMTFGDVVRSRISSQAQKRRWRSSTDRFALANIADATPSYRSRDTIDLMVMAPLYEEEAASQEVLDTIGSVLNTNIYSLGADKREHRQAMLLGEGEVQYLASKARGIAAQHPDDAEAAKAATAQLFEDEEDNFKAFRYNARLAAGLEAAMFGRMVTSDTRANIDGAIAVAHAFTVHESEHEDDFFTAVDDLHGLTNSPAANMLGHAELTSGLYYGYVVADTKQLVSNTEGIPARDWLNGERAMAGEIVHNMIQLIATVSTAAKLGSTAAYTHASFLMVEMGDCQPRTLADAFRVPSKPTLEDAIGRLGEHMARRDAMTGAVARGHAAIVDTMVPGSTHQQSVSDLAQWAHQAIMAGEVS